jgi:endonuclease/exonuclease/phosphatase family metal-dependent hydrolase
MQFYINYFKNLTMRHFFLLLTFVWATVASEAINLFHDTIKVATFNIRYDNPDDGINAWKLRKDSVSSFFDRQGLGIFGLQEVLNSQLQDLKQALPGYDALGVGRDDGKTKGEYSPVFYCKKRFTTLKWGVFWLSLTPNKAGSRGWDAGCNRIATWVKFKDKKSGKIFFFVATHLDNDGVAARKNSVVLIQNQMRKIAGKTATIIIAGDFNSSPDDVAYKIMTDPQTGFVDTRSVAKTVSGVTWSFHGFGQTPLAERQLIDFVFIKGPISVLSCDTPFIEHDGHFLSDHNPVLVVLLF